MSGPSGFSRRRFLALMASATAGTAILAACQPQTVEVTKIVEKPVEVTKVVKEQVEVTKVVEKSVEVTKVVEKQVQVTPTPKPATKGAVNVWSFPNTDDDENLLWKPLMIKFHDQYPAIDTKIEVQPWSGRREKMLAAFAAGNPPDIAFINSDSLSLFGSNGALQDAGSLIAPDIFADMPPEVTKSGISWKGKKIYTPISYYGSSPAANEDLLTGLGLDPKKSSFTWQEVLDLGAKAKPKEWYANAFNTTQWGAFVELVWQAGGTVYSEDATKVLLDQPAAEEALTFWVDMFQKGYVPKEGAVGSEQEASQIAGVNYFLTNKQVLMNADSQTINNTLTQAPKMKLNILQPFKNKKQVAMSNSEGWGIFNKAKNTDSAVIWTTFMMQPDILGFYCSVTGEVPSRTSALPFWIIDPTTRKFYDIYKPFSMANADANFFWQEGKTTSAPQFQAAVLGKKPVKQALADAQKDLQKLVDAFWAKQK